MRHLKENCRRLKENNIKFTDLTIESNQLSLSNLLLVSEALRENNTLRSLMIKVPKDLGEAAGIGIDLILQNPQTAIRELWVEMQHGLGAEGTRRMAEGLRKNRSLKILRFRSDIIEIEEVREIIRALRENHSIAEIMLHARDGYPGYFVFRQEEKKDEEELNALLTRNREEAMQQRRALEIEGNIFRRCARWREALEIYERIIKLDRDEPSDIDRKRTAERDKIHANAEASRIFCLEQLSNSIVAAPAPPPLAPAAAARTPDAAPSPAAVPAVEARPATNPAGLFGVGVGGTGVNASSGNNRNNTSVRCHCCIVM